MAVQRPAGVERSCAVRRHALLLLLSGLLLGLAPAPAIRAQTGQAARPEVGGPYAVDIAEAAQVRLAAQAGRGGSAKIKSQGWIIE